MKRTLKFLAIGSVSLALLFVAASALAFWLVDVDALVQEQIAAHKPEIEHQLGRKVEIGQVHSRFFPTLGARIDGIAIAAAPNAAADGALARENPLLQVGSAGFDLDLWGVLTSFGERVELDSVYLDGVRFELIRRADGSLSIDDILARHPAAEEEEKPDEGLDPRLLELLGKVRIGEIRLAGAEIRLVDQMAAEGPVVSEVRKLDLRLRNVGLGRKLAVQFSAAAFQDEPNLDFAASVGPIPADLQIDGLLPIEDFRMDVKGFDLSPLAAYLPGVQAGKVDASWEMPLLASNAPTDLEGFLSIAGLRLAGGAPTDIRADVALRADLRTLDADIRRFDVRIGTIEIASTGGLRDLGGIPRFEAFSVRSPNFDPDQVLALSPAFAAGLPEGSRIRGPIAIDLKASGTATEQTVALSVDATALDVLLPGTFVKPVGTALGLEIDGDFTASAATLRKARFHLDELDLDVTGKLQNFETPSYDFVLSAKPFSFDRLVRLLPQAGAELAAAGTTAQGKGSLSGHLKGAPGSVDADLSLQLASLALTLPDTEVRGDVLVKVFARGNPEAAIQAGLLVDAGPSVIRIPGLLDKAAATPLVLDLVVDKSGQTLRFERFDARLAEARIQASGALDLAGGDSALEFRMLPVDLEKLASSVPALPAEKMKGGKLSMTMRLKGDPSRTETLEVSVPDLDLALGRSDLRASVTVKNLATPDIVAHVRSRFLDVDEWMPADAEEAKEKDGGERQDAPSLKAIKAVATFEIQKALVTGRTLEDLQGRLVVRDGVIHVEEARFGVYDGTVRAAGTQIEFWNAHTPFKARLVVQNVNVAQLAAGEFDTRDLISGRANFDLSLDGEGFDRESLEESLSGGWSLSLVQGRFSGADISKAVLGDLGDLPGLQPKRMASDGQLRDLITSFEVENGRMNLRKPLTLALDGNRMELDGAVGLGGELFLNGTYWVSPRTLEVVTGGHCRVTEAAAVPLQISGSPSKPNVKPDGKAVALTLARSCLAGKAAAAIDRLVGDSAVREVEEKLDAAKAAAQQKLDDSRAEAERRAAAAKAEADRKTQQAKDQAKKKAEEEAKKLKGKFGF